MVTDKDVVPFDSADAPGRSADSSVESRRIVFVIEVTVFHDESQARTTTKNGTPTVCEVGTPVLPVIVPGAGDSGQEHLQT
jgi:hypothetical protein